LPEPLSTLLDPWDTRFGFFWYNDREIFHATQDDLVRQAASMAETGINHVITFSCTHFRWSFIRHWDLIAEALSRVVAACHAHGIRVTEHHSSHLTFNPLNAEDEAFLDRVLKVRGSARTSWDQFREDCDADPDVDGKPLSSFRQIDGRTGEWARSNYRGWCMCFNNPDYRKSYLSYLETLYAVGIDGIMTDDVQWFGEGHSCACAHCRELYREETGCEMPEPGEAWATWHGNYDDPTYVAWLDFRFRSNERFHQKVKDHYDGLGIRPLRPNYVSAALNRNWTGYTLDALPDLDWVFQECCFSTIIRYSWPDWAVESAHRFSVGRRRGIPAMAMFYPDREDSMRFTWGLAMSWGVLYLATPEGFSMNDQEQTLRSFERKHARLLRGQARIARIGFYDSRTNRNLYGEAEARSLRQLRTWMQACYRSNVPFDLFQTEELERMGDYAVVVLNEVAMLSDEEWTAIRSFVVNGGTLVWTGKTGVKNEKGVDHPEGFLARAWNLPGFASACDGAEGTSYGVGKGRILTVAGDLGLSPYEGAHNADRWLEGDVRVPLRSVSGADRATWTDVVDLLVGLLPGGPDLTVENLPGDVTVTAFQTADGESLAVHLVNTAQTLDPPPDAKAGHSDVIPLPRHTGPDISVGIRKPEGLRDRAITSARYHDPEQDEPVALNVEDQGETVRVVVRPGLINCYGLLEVTSRG
jgi:hypothetical protein